MIIGNVSPSDELIEKTKTANGWKFEIILSHTIREYLY